MIVMPMMRRLGPDGGAGNPALAQRHRHRHRQREQQGQHREAAGHRAVGAGHEQPLVADVFVEPAQAGADGGLEGAGLDLAGQRLVAEDQDDGDRAGRQDRRQQRQVAESRSMRCDNGFQRTDGDQQGADRGDAGGPGEQRQCADDDRDRHRQQSAGGHAALHRTPGQQDAQRDDRLGTQPVVQRQPERQEHACRGPRRGAADLDRVARGAGSPRG